MTRFAHMADVHLGAGRSTGRIDEIRKSFELAFDEANKDPNIEFILIAGDVFDRVRPPWSLLADFVQLMRTAEKQIYVLAGNHDTSRVRTAGSFWDVFDSLDLPYAWFIHGYESQVFHHSISETEIDLGIICTPWGALQDPNDRERRDDFCVEMIEEMPVIWVTHGVAEGVTGSHAEFLRPVIMNEEMEKYAYVALGDLHTEGQVQENAWYSGSTDRMNWSDIGAQPHWLDVTLEDGELEVVERYIEVRKMIKLMDLNATGYTGDDLVAYFKDIFVDPDVMMSVLVYGCERSAFRQLVQTYKHFPFLKMTHQPYETPEGDYELKADQEQKSVTELFSDFLNHRSKEGAYTPEFEQRMRTEGANYLERAQETESED